MSVNWISMRNDLTHDPAVIRMAALLGLDEFAVVGRLHAVWAWADEHTTDGRAVGATKMFLDRLLHCEGFADAMVSVEWLIVTDDAIEIPEFEKWNSATAKKRAQNSLRQARRRATVETTVAPDARQVSREPRDKSATRERERVRETIEEKEICAAGGRTPPREAMPSGAFEVFWQAYPQHKRVGKPKAEKAFVAAARRCAATRGSPLAEAARHIAERTGAFGKSPKGLGRFCPHPTTFLNEDRYDDDPATWLASDSDRPQSAPPDRNRGGPGLAGAGDFD